MKTRICVADRFVLTFIRKRENLFRPRFSGGKLRFAL